MKKAHAISATIILYFLLILVLHILRVGGEKYFDIIANTINLITGSIAILFGYSSLKYFGTRSLQGKTILMFTLSIALWLIADLLWSILFENSLVSLSDILWLSGYILVFIGIFMGIRIIDRDFFQDTKKVAVSLMIILSLIIVYLYFFPLAWDLNSSHIENIVTFGYVLADLMLIIPIVFLVASFINGRLVGPWILIGLAIGITLYGDLYYAINYETYSNGDIIDLAWYGSYLLYALAFIYLKHNAKKIIKDIDIKKIVD